MQSHLKERDAVIEKLQKELKEAKEHADTQKKAGEMVGGLASALNKGIMSQALNSGKNA